MSKKWFRFLLLLSWVLPAAGATLFFVEKQSLPPELRNYLDAGADEPPTARDALLALYGLIALVFGVVTTVGLYRFRPWGRTLTLWGVVFGYGLLPFISTQATVLPPFANWFFSLGTVLGGFLLALIYFSPLARHFEREPHV